MKVYYYTAYKIYYVLCVYFKKYFNKLIAVQKQCIFDNIVSMYDTNVLIVYRNFVINRNTFIKILNETATYCFKNTFKTL